MTSLGFNSQNLVPDLLILRPGTFLLLSVLGCRPDYKKNTPYGSRVQSRGQHMFVVKAQVANSFSFVSSAVSDLLSSAAGAHSSHNVK